MLVTGFVWFQLLNPVGWVCRRGILKGAASSGSETPAPLKPHSFPSFLAGQERRPRRDPAIGLDQPGPNEAGPGMRYPVKGQKNRPEYSQGGALRALFSSQETLGFLEEAAEFLFRAFRVDENGSGEPQAENFHKAFSVYRADTVGKGDPVEGCRKGYEIVHIPHRVKAYYKILHENLLSLYK